MTMVLLSILTFMFVFLTAFLGINRQEEIFRLFMICVATLFAVMVLVTAPWFLKITVAALAVLAEQLRFWTIKNRLL